MKAVAEIGEFMCFHLRRGGLMRSKALRETTRITMRALMEAFPTFEHRSHVSLESL
jgi:hypothetical protein